ncbi:MAG TPA: VWA domain-containing protein [Gaiellaceae bacterium]|nr:VWA domain-containing protein [Gaiellaceae bacterium]
MGPVSFLTPIAALVALVGVLSLAAFLRRERRGRRVRETLELAEPSSRRRSWLLAALVAVPALAGVAAAQPVIDRSQPLRERTDAEMFVVVDTSRSMLAAATPSAPTRLERAQAAAVAVRARLPEIPTGVAQVTDWTVPHLFPTVDAGTFRFVLERSVYVESLGSRETSVLATDLTALSSFAGDSYFSPSARRRLLVVLTDGESRAITPDLARLRRAGIRTIFVHVWGADESIWRPKGAEPQYRADASSRQTLARAATVLGGEVFEESEIGAIVEQAHVDLGQGPTRPRDQRDLLALMPYVMLAAIAPLGFLLRHRNL